VPESIVLLHGFSATSRSWDAVAALLDVERYLPVALDLPGHGEATDAPRPITFASCAQHVLDAAPARFTLCGYSLGGRIALHVALAAPGRVERLVLVSCSAGIEDPGERAARRDADRRLADDLEERPFGEFVERWRRQPLFAQEPAHVGCRARADMRRNRPQALAAVLRGVGAGEMQPLWSRLRELRMPARVLAGRRDRKYVALAQRMADALPDGELLVVDGGHALPLENARAIARALEGLDP
jgi:2-succinyl-6-hydroxy-2,4-cyclohexadiene-1-carboxylate synthase